MKSKFERNFPDALFTICGFIDRTVVYLDQVHSGEINDKDFYTLVSVYDNKLDTLLETFEVKREELEDIFYFSNLKEYFEDTYK